MQADKVKLTFVLSNGERREVEGGPGKTVMDVARDNGIEGVDALCGGSMSCGTCHVFLDGASFSRLGAPAAAEIDMLDLVEGGRRPTSRLSCQIRIDASLDGALIEIPESQV